MPKLLCSPSDPQWLELRRSGVTATDITVIMGLVSWDSPWALWHRKNGFLPMKPQSDRMRLGSWLEDAVALEWRASMYGPNDPDWAYFGASGLYASNDRPWQMATPDRILEDRQPVGKPVAVLECKTSATKDGWGHGTAVENCQPDCGVSGGNVVPAHVRAQVLWQMDVMGVAAGHVAVVFLPSGEFRSYTIEHENGCAADRQETAVSCLTCISQAEMRERGLEFWQSLQENRRPPLDGSQATLDAVKDLNAGRVKGKEAEVDEQLAAHWVQTQEYIKGLTRDKRELESEIRQAMGDAQYATVAGQRIARRDVFKKADYTVQAHEEDRLVRIKPKDDEFPAGIPTFKDRGI